MEDKIALPEAKFVNPDFSPTDDGIEVLIMSLRWFFSGYPEGAPEHSKLRQRLEGVYKEFYV